MNTAIMVILVLLAVCVTLCGIIYVQHKQLNEEKKANQFLEDHIEKLQNNIAFLVKHAQEMAQIEKEKEKTFQRIEEARTDEEISDIVSAIVSLNNQRV
jgi:Tfp pilus assembly protein PilN